MAGKGKPYRDLSNQKTAACIITTVSHVNEKGRYFWNCICNCGRTFVAAGTDLTRRTGNSCGCLRKKVIHNIAGQRFGYLVVQYDTGNRSRDRHVLWQCVCDCSEEVIISSDHLLSGRRVSCGKCPKRQSNLHRQTKEALINLGYTIEYEEFPVHQQWFSFDDRVSILKVDIIIGTPRGLVACECNGLQHYEPVSIFGGEDGFRRTQERDILKKRSLDAMGFPLIIVKYDCKDIEAFLKQELEKL